MPIDPGPADALIVVDVQNDFCSGGALAVPGGEDVVPGINRLWPRFGCRVLTQDWHPPGHGSFAGMHPGGRPLETVAFPYGPQTLWPDHCVQGTEGARFHPDLDTDGADMVIRKGFRKAIDSYSAFPRERPRHADRSCGLPARTGHRTRRAGRTRNRLLRRVLRTRCPRRRVPDGGAGGPLPRHRYRRLARRDAGADRARRRHDHPVGGAASLTDSGNSSRTSAAMASARASSTRRPFAAVARLGRPTTPDTV